MLQRFRDVPTAAIRRTLLEGAIWLIVMQSEESSAASKPDVRTAFLLFN